MDTFEKMIKDMPRTFNVLDVGVGGVDGENTSTFLAKQFAKVFGITISAKKAEFWKGFNPNYEIFVDNFYDRTFDRLFDLITLDLTIEQNLLNDWSDTGLKRVHGLLAEDGYLINYVMMTSDYGNKESTPDLINWHAKKFWGELSDEAVKSKLSHLDGFTLVSMEREQRRPEILWVCLQKGKKTTGSSESKEEVVASTEKPVKKPRSRKKVSEK